MTTVTAEFAGYYKFNIEMEVDCEYAEPEYHSDDTGVGIQTSKMSNAGHIVHNVFSAVAYFGKHKLEFSKDLIQKKLELFCELAAEALDREKK